MARQGVLLTILLVNAFYLPTALAGETGWWFFWAQSPRNLQPPADIPDGQPQTNSDFEAMLQKDAINGKILKSETTLLVDGGFTFWWGAFLDEGVVNEKYESLKIISGVNGAGKPERACKIDFLGFPAKEDLADAMPEKVKRSKLLISEADDVLGNATTSLLRDRTHSRSSTRMRPRSRHQKRATITQKDAPKQLKILSLPQGGSLDDLDNSEYKYDDTAGFGTRVYVIDSGLNMDSTEWESDDGRKPDFLFATDFSKKEQIDLDTDPDQPGNGHGTCMADLAVGKVNGVAKRADVTAVQVADGDKIKCNFLAKIQFETNMDALSRIVNDMTTRDLQTQTAFAKSVINMSIGVQESDDLALDDAFAFAFSEVLLELDTAGVSLVAAFPNDPRPDKELIIGWPARFSDPTDDNLVPALITIGNAVINDGTFGNLQGAPWITIYAPGDDRSDGGKGEPGILCARPTGNDNNVLESGTSHATAIVAGLLAYYKGLGLDNTQARNRLLSDSFRRASGDAPAPNMPWNGIL